MISNHELLAHSIASLQDSLDYWTNLARISNDCHIRAFALGRAATVEGWLGEDLQRTHATPQSGPQGQ